MTIQNFLSRLNARQILVHFVATWFFIHAFETFSYLSNTGLVEVVRQSGREGMYDNLTGDEIRDFHLWKFFSGLMGLVLAFLISLIISRRRRWFWINSLIVFVAAWFMGWTGWNSLKSFFWYPGKQFNDTSTEFLVNGTLLLVIGLVLFFLKGLNDWIGYKESLAATDRQSKDQASSLKN